MSELKNLSLKIKIENKQAEIDHFCKTKDMTYKGVNKLSWHTENFKLYEKLLDKMENLKNRG